MGRTLMGNYAEGRDFLCAPAPIPSFTHCQNLCQLAVAALRARCNTVLPYVGQRTEESMGVNDDQLSKLGCRNTQSAANYLPVMPLR